MSVKEQEAQDVLEKREFWNWAEKARSPRLDYLRKAAWSKAGKGSRWLPGVKVCTEGLHWFTEVFKKADPSEPFMITRAKALAALLDNVPIFIIDNARIVGYVGAAPNLVYWNPMVSHDINSDIYNDRMDILNEEDRPWVKEAIDFWHMRNFKRVASKYHTKRERIGADTGTGGQYRVTDYIVPQLDWMFPMGFDGMLKDIEDNLADANKKMHHGVPDAQEQIAYMSKINTWIAMKICLEAAIRYARKYSRLARIVAENFEPDPLRKQDLLRISETCEKVPARAPEHFWEAIQFEHFVQVAYRYEWHNVSWSSRYDYHLFPYYKRDVIDEKNITREDAVEYCADWLLNAFTHGKCLGRGAREALQGTPGPYVWTLGGVDENGNDACNDLTDAFLDAAMLVRVCDPTFGFRYHPKARTQTLRKVFECIRHGLGYPSIRNDTVLIPNIVQWFGHPIKEARRWIHQACMSPAPDTKWGAPATRYPHPSLSPGTKPLEWALHNGFDPVIKMQVGPKTGDPTTFKSFEEFYNAWYTQLEHHYNLSVRMENINRYVAATEYPRPMATALYERCIETGENCDLSKERSSPWFTYFAGGDVGDALAAVKKLVFEDKKYTMAQLMEALNANWEGYEEMRIDFVRAPKWGNDDDYVDKIWKSMHDDFGKLAWSVRDYCGQPYPLLPQSIASHIAASTRACALPNGRRVGDPLYDGGCSPGPGLDKKGPTAVLRSVAKLDHIGSFRGNLLNQRLSPTQLAGDKGFELWRNYIMTWHDLGINHVQFNMVDNETLRDAQKEPEKYAELIVRIAGYSAHFVEMNRKTQDSIIARNVQKI
ncbi:MAG: pyruvate formate lyase family protein [Thermodesulfobacteriota bacterium]|nr:pyruvate formate lyase family protein [Thermodesulfobacteriota bacterium]